MFALGASFAPCALRNSFSSYRCCTQMIVISNVPDTLYVSCPDVVGFFFFLSLGPSLLKWLQCWRENDSSSVWSLLFPQHAENLFVEESILCPSQQIPQSSISGDGAAGDGECPHPKDPLAWAAGAGCVLSPSGGAEPQPVLLATTFSSWICLGEKWGLEGVGIPSSTCGNVSSLVHRSKGVYPRAYSVPPTLCSSLLKY